MIFFRPFECKIAETKRISIKFGMSGPSSILPGEFNLGSYQTTLTDVRR